MLADLPERENDLAINQAKVAGIRRNINRSEFADEAVKRGRGKQFEECFAAPLGALRVNQLVPVLPFGDELQNHFGRVLEIGINDRNGVAFGVINAGADRDLMSKVARKDHAFHARVLCAQFAPNVRRAILTAVEHKHEFAVTVKLIHHGARAAIKFG